MASWRDTASQRAQEDLDGLLDRALGFAQQQLNSHGEFYPYAVVVDADGQRMVAASTGSDRPESADVIATLIDVLSGQRDQLRGAAIIADTQVPALGGDAVRVTLEHSERVALTVLMPYRRRWLGRRIDYGDLQVSQADAVIWSTDPT